MVRGVNPPLRHEDPGKVTTSAGIEVSNRSVVTVLELLATLLRRLALLWVALSLSTLAYAEDQLHPLKPSDVSSPRATLKTLLDSGDILGAYLARDYLPSPSRAKFDHLFSLAGPVVKCLNVAEIPPAARSKTALGAAAALYETLSRIQLPLADHIPDTVELSGLTGSKAERWVIPETEIVIERVKSGPRAGDFLFSPETVARADEFYNRVRQLPYTRPVALRNFRELTIDGGGWMIPIAWVKALPLWLRAHIAGQAAWKWIVFSLMLALIALSLRPVSRLSEWGSDERPLLQAFMRLALPLFVLITTPVVTYFALVQINFIGQVAMFVEIVATVIMFLAGAWIVWRIAPVLAEALIATPKINTESIDAHLIRICTRLLGIVAAATLLGIGAGQLGLPVYGIVAGLGVGGLAIALAAQPTVENLIGGLSLFADQPIRVGDLCQYGDKEGTIEGIGIRSTRIRGRDRTLTTVPNGELSKMAVVSLAERDQMLIQSVIGLRYETSPEQLRYLLIKLRETLLHHPTIDPEGVRVRFVGFGASSLDVELFGYVRTTSWTEFLRVREEIFLQVMDIVSETGTGFAFPSQTVYLGRDGGLDTKRTQAAEARLRQWVEDAGPAADLPPRAQPGQAAEPI
jgi:MscS family membrane protein